LPILADGGDFNRAQGVVNAMSAELSEFSGIVINIIEDLTQDWGLDLEQPIGMETSLVGDLEFASVDVIQLCVAIEEHYQQRKMGFQDLLMVDGRYVDDLRVRQFAEFLHNRISGGLA
jgi:acyl carrier protein